MHPCAPADESFERFASSIKHIACDRTDAAAMKQLLGNQGFEGEGTHTLPCSPLAGQSAALGCWPASTHALAGTGLPAADASLAQY